MPVNPTLDLLMHGANGAHPASDTRDPETVAQLVAAELARGATIDDACAAAVVPPARYLAWVEDHADTIGAAHARALRIRAQLLADTPLTLARELRAHRNGERASHNGARLGDVVKALEAEARLTAQGAGAGQAEGAVPVRVVVSFEAPTAHAVARATDGASVAGASGKARLSGDVGGSYVIVDDASDA